MRPPRLRPPLTRSRSVPLLIVRWEMSDTPLPLAQATYTRADAHLPGHAGAGSPSRDPDALDGPPGPVAAGAGAKGSPVADISPHAEGADPAADSPRRTGDPARPAPSNPNQLSVAVEREYVQRAAHGDLEAVGLLYDAYVTRLYRYCLARVGNETDAEDLAEEIFLKVLGAVDGFEWRDIGAGERSPFAAWLFRIAHNHVVSFHRRATVHRRVVKDDPGAEVPDWIADERRGPQDLAETQLTIEEVFDAVELLPEAQRDVIRLRFGAGLSVAETAEALGKQQGNVKVLQHKGVQRLKQILRDTRPEPSWVRSADQ